MWQLRVPKELTEMADLSVSNRGHWITIVMVHSLQGYHLQRVTIMKRVHEIWHATLL